MCHSLLLGCPLSTGAWVTYQGPHAWRKMTLHPLEAINCHQLVSQLGLGSWDPLCHPRWKAEGLDHVQVLFGQPQLEVMSSVPAPCRIQKAVEGSLQQTPSISVFPLPLP